MRKDVEGSGRGLIQDRLPFRHLPAGTEKNHEKLVRIAGLRAEI
jgi:hypothetical protein